MSCTALRMSVLCLLLPAHALAAEPSPREIVVSGEAVVRVPSDRVSVSAQISTVQKNYKNAVNEVEGKLKAAGEALRKLGVADTGIRFTDMYANPHYEYTEKGTKLTGFEVSRTLTVELDSLALLGPVYEVLLAANVTAVDGPMYAVRERETAYRRALAVAAADAEAKAQLLAKERGLSNLRLVRLDESDAMVHEPPTKMMRAMAAEAADMATPAFSGNVSEIRARVQAVYEFGN